MNVAQRLLDAVLHDPDDDPPRLILADWYQEQGQPERAALIRDQIAMAALGPLHPDHGPATWRAERLMAIHGRTWRSELPEFEGLEWGEFHRGFPGTVVVHDLAALFRHAEELPRHAPVHTVDILGHRGDDDVFVVRQAIPWIRTVRVLGSLSQKRDGWASLSESDIESIRTLVSDATALECVDLEAEDEFPSLVIGDATLRRCTAIRIVGNHTVGRPFVALLAGHTAPLQQLDLGTLFVDHDSGYFEDPTLGIEGARAITQSTLATVGTLNLDLQRLGTEGFREVCTSMPHLTALSVRSVGLDASSVRTFAPGTPITHLTLRENPITDAGVQALAADPRLASLQHLDLDTCELTREGVVALTRSPFWSTLRVLRLGNNALKGIGRVWANADPPAHLHTLHLEDTELSMEDLTRLGRLEWFQRLTVLNLAHNDVGPALRNLGGRDAGPPMALCLRSTRLSEAALRALAPRLRGCQLLDLGENRLGEALPTLFDEPCPRLQALWLDGVGTMPAHRMHHGIAPHLYQLSLANVSLGADALRELLSLGAFSRVTDLDLSSCGLTDDAIAALVTWTHTPGADTLLLGGNDDITTDGLLALAKGLPRPLSLFRGPGRPWGMEAEVRAALDQALGPRWFHHAQRRDTPWTR